MNRLFFGLGDAKTAVTVACQGCKRTASNPENWTWRYRRDRDDEFECEMLGWCPRCAHLAPPPTNDEPVDPRPKRFVEVKYQGKRHKARSPQEWTNLDAIKVVDTLEGSNCALTIPIIERRTGLRGSTLRLILNRLVEQGRIKRGKRGTWISL